MNRETFFETIKVMNGIPLALPYHSERMQRTMPNAPQLNLEVPEQFAFGTYKCRVVYSSQIESIEYLPYTLPDISCVKLVQAPELQYASKFQDRSAIDAFVSAHSEYDDVIFIQDNLITDASFANIAILKDGQWLTPAKPLLHGTKRKQLLDRNLIKPADITPQQLLETDAVYYINAMIPLGKVQVHNIVL